MSVLEELGQLSAAEEFFVALDLPYDPNIVNVARLHILRRMGEYLRRDEFAGFDEAAARAACRAHLEKAYGDFVRSTPIEQRVFKVHKDAIKPIEPPKKPFVPLADLTGSDQ
ncbi:MAG: nitrogenase stabilizing/protective protein NifW [Stellaceae bacterium]